MLTDTTRPAGEGTGIDLSGIDVEKAIFDATGGGYGTPQGGTDTDPALLPAPVRDGTWVAGDGRTPDGTDPADTFDPGTIVDPLRDIGLTTDPILPDNPLLPLMQEPETPHFANGGPEGAGWLIPVLIGAGVVVGGVIAYNVSKDVKDAVDGAANAVKGFFEGLWVPDDGAADTGGEKSLKGFTSDKNLKDFDKPPEYYVNPEADTGVIDDSAVLRQAFGDLLGSEGIGLALDPDAFMKGGSVLDALNGGKGAALGDIMAGLDGFGIDARDGLTLQEVGALFDGLGLGEMMGWMPFDPAIEQHALLIEAREVEGLFTATDTTILSLGREEWW